MTQQQDIQNWGKDGNTIITDELLLAYTEGLLDKEQQRLLEEKLSEESPDATALEGLQMLPVAESRQSLAKLNRLMYREILRKRKRDKRRLKIDNWSVLAVFVILILVGLAYFLIRFCF